MTIEKYKVDRRAQGGWAVFQLGGETTNVLLLYFIFAPYMATVVFAESTYGQVIWGIVAGIAGFIIAISGPILGLIADRTGGRKRFLGAAVVLAAFGASALWFATPDLSGWPLVMVMAAAGVLMVGAELSNIFHNAFLPSLAGRAGLGRLSGISIGMGIFWGILCLGLFLIAFTLPDTPFLGLSKATHETDRIAGPLAALAWILFTIPLMLWTPDEPFRKVCLPIGRIVRSVLMDTYRAMKAEPNAARFVIARMIYQDGIGVTLTFGSIYAASLFGWGTQQLAVFGVTIMATSATGAFIGGVIDDRIGGRNTIVLALCLMLLAIGALFLIDPPSIRSDGFLTSVEERVFIAIGAVLGLTLGPAQGSGRTVMARIAPYGQRGQWYGIMALTGNAVAFTGPLLVALVTGLSGSQKAGLAVAPVLIVIGLGVLLCVRPDQVHTTDELSAQEKEQVI